MAKRSESSGLTRGQSHRLRREAEMQRIIWISTAIVSVAVVALIGFALVNEFILKPNRAIIEVNGDEITATKFEDQVRFDYYRSFGDQPPEVVGIDPAYLGQIVYDGMINDLLLAQHAEEMGISVSDQEVQEQIELSFGYDAGEPEPTATPLPTSTPAGPTRTPTLTPTYVYTLTPVPTATLDPNVTPSPTATASPTPSPTPDGPTPTLEPTQTLPPTLTPEPVTEESFTEDFNGFVSDMSAATGLAESRIRELWNEQTRLTLLREKVFEALDIQVPETRIRVHAAHLLVSTEDEALAALERINNGEDFAVVAAELSRDSNAYVGGDLGWFAEGEMVAPFEEAALALEPGEVSGPVQTEFGWHLIKVYDKVEEPLTPTQILQAQQNEFSTQVDEWRNEADLVIDDTWQEFIPADLP